jgi:hypothetical protein
MAIKIYRAPRKTDFWKPSTPQVIGPGVYSQESISHKESAVPFDGGAERKPLALNVSYPGPGHYEGSKGVSMPSNRFGLSSFVNKTSRLAPNAPGANIYNYPSSFKNPGPGYYEVTDETAKKETRYPRTSKGLSVKASSVSIPHTKPPKTADTTDKTEAEVDWTHKRIPKADFTSSKDRRKLYEPTNSCFNEFPPRENPGPGTYDIESDRGAQIGTSVFVSKVKKAHQEEVAETKKTPGPGAYDTSLVLNGNIAFNTSQVFVNKCERGDTWANVPELPFTVPERLRTPAVGAYNLTDMGKGKEEARKKVLGPDMHGVTKPAFNASDERPCLTDLKSKFPGPGAYIPITVTSLMPGGVSNFGARVPRFAGLFAPKQGPGPGMYDEKSGKKPGPDNYSVFRSKSARFKDRKRQVPAVGEYQGHNEWKVNQARAADAIYQNQVISFDTSSVRFSSREVAPGIAKTAVPGPGAYRSKSSSSPRPQGPMFLKSKRFEGHGAYATRPQTTLGPGQYSADTSFSKKSHNITIDASSSAAQNS